MPIQYGQQPGDEAKAMPAFECDIDTKIETTGAHWKATMPGRTKNISTNPPPSDEHGSEKKVIGSEYPLDGGGKLGDEDVDEEDDETTNEAKTSDENADMKAFVKGDILSTEALERIAKELADFDQLDAIPPVVSANNKT
jgi:hypothetical protein